ncbi:hypothetical protein LZ31DRAFT_598922 [Colletotrichum somersetense]|nr:hypothetical protein LZ31DRAFT_598922 [Colletotrichum somersetense]
MRRFLAVVLLLGGGGGGGGGFLLPTGALAVEMVLDQSDDGRFRSSPGMPDPRGAYRDNPVYAVGDSVELRWETSFEAADLVLWQEQPDGGDARPAFATLAVGAKARSVTWTVGYDGFPAHHDPGLSQVYYLELSRAGETRETEAATGGEGGGGGMRSRYFNITGTTTTTTRSGRGLPEATARAKRTTETTTTTTTTTAGTNSSAATAAPSPPPTPTVALIADEPDTQPHPANSSRSGGDGGGGDGVLSGGGLSGGGLSGGAVAGIAAGAFLCGLALMGLAGWAVRRRRRAGGKVAHTQGDIVMYAERQLREKGAVGWGSPPSPLRRKVRLPVEESREALAFEVDAREAAERERWAAWGAAAAVDRAMAAGCGGGGGTGARSMGARSMGAGSMRSESSGWRSATMRSWV